MPDQNPIASVSRLTAAARMFFLAALPLVLTLPSVAGSSEILRLVEQLSDAPVELPEDIAITADDRHIYMLGSAALAVFERDPQSGQARFLEAHLEGRRGVRGLRRTTALALTEDGRFIYTASPRFLGSDGVDRGAVAIFEREPADGSLRFVGVHTDGFTTETMRFDGAHAVLSPDGVHLYVISSADRAVLTFEREGTDGRLRFVGATRQGLAGGNSSPFASFDSEGSHLYMTNSTRGSVVVYRRDGETGVLRRIQELMSNNPDLEQVFPVHPGTVVVSPDDRHVYVTNVSAFPFDAGDGMVVTFRRNASGRLALRSAGDLQATPYRMALSPDGRFLYAPGLGNYIVPLSEMGVYARHEGTGALEQVQLLGEEMERFDDPSHHLAVAVSHDGRHVYSGVFSGRAPAVFEPDAADGSLSLAVDPDDPSGGLGRLRGASRGAVSPDGLHLYVVNPATSTLSVFRRRGNGGLRLLEVTRQPVSRSNTVTTSADGRYVYAFDHVFRRRPSGRLTRVEQSLRTHVRFNAEDIAPSPDGRHIYVAAQDGRNEAVRAYRHEGTSGRITQIDIPVGPVPGLGALRRSRAVTVSHDGRFIYALGLFERSRAPGNELDAIWSFRRRAGTGLLELVDYDVLGPSDHTVPAGRLSLSPDSRQLYVARPTKDRLRVYTLDRRSGELERLERHENGRRGVEGLDEPRDVEVSASGLLVYVASRRSDAVAIFERDPQNGRLTFLEAITDEEVGGLFRLDDIVVSPDGRSVYALSPRLSSVTTFARTD